MSKVWNATKTVWEDWSKYNFSDSKIQASKIDYIETIGDKLFITKLPDSKGIQWQLTYQNIHGTYKYQFTK